MGLPLADKLTHRKGSQMEQAAHARVHVAPSDGAAGLAQRFERKFFVLPWIVNTRKSRLTASILIPKISTSM